MPSWNFVHFKLIYEYCTNKSFKEQKDGGLPDKEKEEQKDFKFYLKFSPPPTKIFNRNILQFISLLSVNTEKRVYWLTSQLLFLLFS